MYCKYAHNKIRYVRSNKEHHIAGLVSVHRRCAVISFCVDCAGVEDVVQVSANSGSFVTPDFFCLFVCLYRLIFWNLPTAYAICVEGSLRGSCTL